MLDEAKQNQFIDLIENYVYTLVSDHIKELNESEDYESFDMDELKQYAKNSISEWFFEDEDMLSEDVINDQVVIDDIVDTIFEDIEEACKKESCDCGKPDCPICSKKESCKEGDDSDEDPDKDDDKDDDDDDVDEAALLTKHKITKIQSVLDARKRATDPAWKMSRRRTLMKQAARGGRVVNKKLSKAVKKSYRQGFGKRWEDDEDSMLENIANSVAEACKKESDSNEKDDIEGEPVNPSKNKKKLVKRLASTAKVQKEAMEESVREALSDIPAFGTLNESESVELTEKFASLLSEHVDRGIEFVTESLIEEMENFKNEVLIPEYTNKVEGYLSEEMIPHLERNVSDYLDELVESRIDEIMSTGKVVKSRESLQLEYFAEKLIEMIEEELQIYPEQEDAVIALESKCSRLEQSLQEAKVEKIKARNAALELENKLWIEQNMPSNLSEAGEDKLRNMLDEIIAESHTDFISKAERTISEFITPKKKELTQNVNESNNNAQRDPLDIVERTLQFMRRK